MLCLAGDSAGVQVRSESQKVQSESQSTHCSLPVANVRKQAKRSTVLHISSHLHGGTKPQKTHRRHPCDCGIRHWKVPNPNPLLLTEDRLRPRGKKGVGLLKSPQGDFPGGPVVKTPCFHCRGPRFHPWSGKFRMPRGVAKKKKAHRTRARIMTRGHDSTF